MQEDLVKLVDNIYKQEIKLLNVNFHANEKISGIFLNESIDSKLAIGIENIGSGQANTEENSEKSIFIFADYKFDLSYQVSKEKKSTIDIIEISAQYRVMVFLGEQIEKIIEEKEEDYYKKIVVNFFNTTGRVMIYPYFRNISNILARESGYVLPILPPLKIS